MNKILLAVLIAVTVTQVLVVVSLVDDRMIAKAQNTTTPENKTLSQIPMEKMIIRNNIVTVINTTTNETISVTNLTENAGNATTNDTLATSTGNATTNVNLTAKFKELQGK